LAELMYMHQNQRVGHLNKYMFINLPKRRRAGSWIL